MAGMAPDDGGMFSAGSNAAFKKQLNKVYSWYTGGFIAFVIVLAILEQMGLPRNWIGYIFLAATVLLYAGIGVMSRTNDAAEYYVAGRRVPAIYNGMAAGADWMSAASFIGMAGTLYLTGYGGLAFIMGWTGGYCLVALFLAPYLRKFGQFTIPDFLGARYDGNLPRLLGILAAILCSFTYVVAQIYGVGLITTRLTGVAFELGIFLGLGGILVCSFLGGMRAVTWTQVAQYIILIVAYLIPVVWLSVKQTGVPVPQAVYGYQLEKVTAAEKRLTEDPKEKEVRDIFAQRSAALAEKLKDPAAALAADKDAATKKLEELKAANAPAAEVAAGLATLVREGMPVAAMTGAALARLPTEGASTLVRLDGQDYVLRMTNGTVAVLGPEPGRLSASFDALNRLQLVVNGGSTDAAFLSVPSTTSSAAFGLSAAQHPTTRLTGQPATPPAALTVEIGTTRYAVTVNAGPTVSVPAGFPGTVGFTANGSLTLEIPATAAAARFATPSLEKRAAICTLTVPAPRF